MTTTTKEADMTTRSKRKPGLRITVSVNSDVNIDCPDGSQLVLRNEGKHPAQLRFTGPGTFVIRRVEKSKVSDSKWQEIQAAYFEKNEGGGDE
jgi:hypothetical protein